MPVPATTARFLACSTILCWSAACSQLSRKPEADSPGAAETAQDADETDAEESNADAKAERKRKDKLRDKGRELEKKERALHVAQLELKAARQGAEEGETAQDFDLAQAARALEEAERGLALFREVERPMLEAERGLSLNRAERRLHEAQADLEGILAIYEEETEASAKEEIILRYQRDVEFAQRSLEIQRQKAALSLESDDQKRERVLTTALKKANRALDKARHEKEHARVKAEISLMKNEHALIELEEEIEELRGELRKLKKAGSE